MKLARIAAALAFVALVPSIAQAQTLTACYVPKSGTVYRIKVEGTPTKCAQNHVEFTWSMAGQVGPEGPQGPQGEMGPQGPAGAAYTTGLERLERAMTMLDPGETELLDLVCTTAGRIAIGGGWTANNGVLVHSSEPNGDGWRYRVTNMAATEQQVRLWIVCINK